MSYDNNRRNGGRDSHYSNNPNRHSSPQKRNPYGQPSQRTPQPRSSGSRQPVSRNSNSQEMDRYNYVNRDIYSSSKRKGSGGNRYSKPPKKKGSKAKKIVIILICVVLAIVLAIVGFGAVMLGRVNRQNVDTTSYIQTPSDAPNWDVLDLKGTTNILLIGADKNEDGTNGRSDSMMLVSLDHKNKTMKMVSFLRDLYVEIPTHGKDKLNAAYMIGGAGMVMQTLENNFRINIDKYILTDFEDFADMIDLMGGIDLEMTQEEADYMNKIKGSDLKEGRNHLRGTLALYYARMRYLDSDFGRTGRQRQVILAMVEKMKKLNMLESTSFLYQFLPYITTNLSNGELLSLATKAMEISDYESDTLYMPYKDTYTEKKVPSVGEALVPDLAENAGILREFLYPDGTSSSNK